MDGHGAPDPSPAVAAYLAGVPEPARAAVDELRRLVSAAAPGAVETFSYRMISFRYRGKVLGYVGAREAHTALYGMDLSPFEAGAAPYRTGKGTLRFPLHQQIPGSLVQELVRARRDAIEAAAPRRRHGSAARPPA